jgi:small GTP-binding protein
LTNAHHVIRAMDISRQLELPNDIWRVIFSLIGGIETLVQLQRACKFFKREIKFQEVHKLFGEAKMTSDIILNFSRRKRHHATHLQVKQHFKHVSGADHSVPKFKVVVVGPKHSGKSSLCQTFLYQHFDPVVRYDTFASRRLRSEVIISELDIWDTAGHEKYSTAIANNYYSDASAVLICFSLEDRNTFIQALDVFIKDCLKYEALLRHTVFYLVGNKSDLNSERKVQRSEIEWASSVLTMKYFELAATNVGVVTAAFRKIADDLLQVACCTTNPPNNSQSRWCSVM